MRVISTSWKVWIFLLAATIIIGVATASEHGGVPVTIGGMLTAGNAKSNFDVVQETDKEPSPEPEKINSALAKHIFQLLDGSVHNRHLSNRSINSTSARVDRKGSTPGSGISARKRLRGRETSSRLPPSLNVPLVPKDSVTISQPRSLDEKVPVRTVDDEIRHVAKIMMKLQEKLDYAKATEMRKSQNRPKLPITNIDDGTDLSSERGDTEKLNKTVRKYIEPGGYLSKLQQEAIQFENEKQVKRDGNKSKLANIGGQYKYPNRPISTNIATDGIETEDAVDPTTVVGVRDLPVPISSASKLTPKIINGEDAPLDMYPWYAGLGEGFCGGTLVAPEFILTAAHCLGQFFENVTVGKFCTDRFDNCGQKKDVVNVIDIIPHPKFKFDGEDLSFDIGLVQIERTSIAPTRMDLDGVSSQYADGTQMWVAGFGVDEVPEFVDGTGSSTPNSLQHANVDYIREVACVKSLEGQMVLSNAEQFICATSSPKDSCFGDSGGPLFDNDRNLLLGVVSFGLGCLTGTYPSGYTRVSHFKTWITQNICANHDFPKPTFCDNLDDTPNPTASPTQGPCEDEEITFELDLFTDLFAEETSWQLDDILDGSTVSYGPEQYNTFMPLTEYYSRLCLPCGLYEFTMKDAYGDGLPNGSYTLTINSEIVKANYDTPFSSQITTIDGGSTCGEFTCPDGGMMINLSVVTGASFTTWAFLTDSTPIDFPFHAAPIFHSMLHPSNLCLSNNQQSNQHSWVQLAFLTSKQSRSEAS
uniref:Peptidase S1 domain-containing protein n=1 Tax=Chaetoceros debilis TaxID=122233 RepID=A0A6S8WYX6_9STRA